VPPVGQAWRRRVAKPGSVGGCVVGPVDGCQDGAAKPAAVAAEPASRAARPAVPNPDCPTAFR
jgi:hypothetical protein